MLLNSYNNISKNGKEPARKLTKSRTINKKIAQKIGVIKGKDKVETEDRKQKITAQHPFSFQPSAARYPMKTTS